MFPWRDIFRGSMLDVGCGDDKLPFDNVTGFDTPDGDANKLSSYFAPESFDLIHGSQILEHLFDAASCIADWLTLLKPGGHLVATVPDIGAYERFAYPSTFNSDHKASFSMIYLGSVFPVHYHIPTLLTQFDEHSVVKLARYVERNYDWKKQVDQTMPEEDSVEIWNEFVIQKR